jgi:fibronectin-binding autotransporter adhesin
MSRLVRGCAGVLSFFLVLLVGTLSASAAVFTWNNTGTNWMSTANWTASTGNGMPGLGDVALFNNASYTNQPSFSTSSGTVGGIWDTGTGAVNIGTVLPNALTLTATTINGHSSYGMELDSGSGSLTIAAPLTLGAAQTWLDNSTNPVTISGNVTSNTTGELTIASGSGTFNFGGNVTFATPSTSNAVEVIGNVTTSGTVSDTVGNFLIAPGGTVTVSGSFYSNVTCVAGNNGATGPTAPAANLVISGGTFTSNNTFLDGQTSHGNGNVVVNGGLFQVTSASSFNFDGTNGSTAGTLSLNGGKFATAKQFADGSTATNNVINFNGGTYQALASVGNIVQTPADFTTKVGNGGAVIDVNSYSVTISNNLVPSSGTATGGLTLLSTLPNGALTLSGTNTYTGPTTITGGRLSISGTASLPANSAVTISGNSTGGGQLFVNFVGTLSQSMTLSGVGFQDANNVNFGAIRSNNDTFSGVITAAGNTRIGTYAGAGATITGQLTGGYGFDFYDGNSANNQTGTILLANTGAANNYSGNTSITNVDYTASTGCKTVLKLGASEQIPSGPGNGILLFNGADANHMTTLELNGFNQTLNGISSVAAGGAVIQNTSAGTSTLTVGAANTASSFAGVITDGGTGSMLVLNKIGSGLLVLSGASNYVGNTTVSGGTLAVDAVGTNTGALGATAVSVSGGAAFVARGNTSIASGGGLTVAGGGGLSLVDGTVNTLTVNGNVALGSGNQGTNLSLELGTGTSDLLNVTGVVSLAGTSVVNIALATGASVVNGSYDLVTATGGLAINNFTLGSKPVGFNSYTLSTPNPSTLMVTVGGNPTPATAYWTGAASRNISDTANKWGSAGANSTSNWSTTPDGLTDPQQVPGSTTNLYFTAANATGVSGSLSTTLDSGYSLNSLTFAVPAGTAITSAAVNTSGNLLTLGSGGLTLANSSNASATITGSGGVVVGASQTWANNSNSQTLNISAPVSALAGATTLTLSGAGAGSTALGAQISNGASGGTLSLALNNVGPLTLGSSSANTFSGGVTISGGLVQLAGVNALGSGALTVNAGTLNLGGYSQTVGNFSGAAGTIWNNSGAGVATLSVGAGGGTYSGLIADNDGVHTGGQVALNVTAAGGELTLTGPNTYSGGTTLGSGTLNLVGNAAIGSGRLTMSGGNLDNTSGGTVVLGNIPQTWSSSFSYYGGSLLNLGTGPVTVSAPVNVTVANSSGTLEIDGNITSAASSLATYGAGTVVLAGVNTIAVTSGNVLSLYSNVVSQGTTSISGGNFVIEPGTTFTILSGSFSSTAPLAVIGNTAGSTPANMLVSGGTYSQPSGTLYIAQHAPGQLTIQGGLVNLASDLQFQYNATSAGTLNLNGGVLQCPGLTSSPAAGQTLNFNGGLLQLTASSANLIAANAADVTMNIGNGNAVINLNGFNTTISNALNGVGTGGLTVYSATPGTLTLGGNNTYLGPTQISGCSLILNSSTLGSGGALTINSGARVDLGNSSQSVGAVSVTAPAAVGNTIQNGSLSGTSYAISNSSGNVIITASLQDSSTGSSSFTMSGTGGVAMLTANNSFTGPTNVTGGTLVVDNSNSTGAQLASTSVSVAGGAGFVVRGNTSIGGSLSVAGGGGLDLRDGLASNLTNFTVNGNLAVGSGGTGSNLFFEIGSNFGNPINDLLNVTGSAALSGTSTINLSSVAGSSPTIGTYTLIQATGGLSASNFAVATGPTLKGFDSYSLFATTPTDVILTVTGNPTPTIAYWTGKASTALADSANQWAAGNTSAGSNWSTDAAGQNDALQVPGSVTDVYFTAANAKASSGSLTTTLDNAYSIQGMFFAVSPGSITGVTVNTGSNVLTLGGDGLTLATSSASGTISGGGSILLSNGQNWANNVNNQALTVTVPISPAPGQNLTLALTGTGTGGVVLSGAIGNGQGTLALSFAQSGTTLLGGSVSNTYSGGTTISAGSVKLGNSGALGYTAAPLTINGGALDLNGFSLTVGAFSGVGGTILNNSGSGVATLTAGQGNLIYNTTNYSGTIADNDGVHTGGAVALNIVGSGELTLSGTNLYSGGTTVGSAATLGINSNFAIGNGRLTMNGGNLDNSSGTAVVLGNIPQVWNGSSLQYLGSSLLNLGTGPVTMNVPTTLNVQSSTGTLEIDGNITMTGGTNQFATAGAGTVVLTGSNNISVISTNEASFAAANTISTGTLVLSGGNFVLQPSATFTVAAGLVSASSPGVGTVVGNTAGGTAYMVVSGGTFQQAGAQLYIGQHSAGVLDITGNGLVALGTSPLAFAYNGNPSAGTLQLDGGTLQCSGFSTGTAGQTLNLNGGVLELTSSSANLVAANSADFSMNVEDGGAVINLNGFSTTISNSLAASGTGGLTLLSAIGGSLTLSGTNTYTGGTFVNSGTLIIDSPLAILAGSNLTVGAWPAGIAAAPTAEAAAGAPATVPEPSMLVLLAAGAGGLAAACRRRLFHKPSRQHAF